MPDTILSMEGDKSESEESGNQINESDNSNIHGWFKSLSDWLPVEEKEVEKAATPSQGSKPRIHKCTPPVLYFKFKSCFSPQVFVLGPICFLRHFYCPSDRGKIEEPKLRLTARFIKDYSLEESICDKILMNIRKFRQYYDDDCLYYLDNHPDPVRYDYSDEELTRMFIVDGCALLFYMVCYVLHDLHKLGIEDAHLDSLNDDIFKLDNQLPYAVLEKLVECSKLGKEMPSLIHDFVKLHSVIPGIETSKIRGYKPVHLLDLLWTRMRGIVPLHGPNLVRQFSMALTGRSYPTAIMPIKNQERKKGPIKWSPSYSVKDLKAAWIHLKPGAMLTNVSFRPGIVSGELELPRLIIDKSTKVKLLNLMGYEMCPGFKNENDLELTSYICFLHSFVANVEDVAELRSTGILLNYLSNNEEVLALFSDITSDLVPNPTTYHAIQQQIQKHLDRKGRTTIAAWFAEAAQVYFKTPWSTIAVLAAAFAIILSVVQTYFTIFPP